jgi:hypothetical protein
VIYRRHKKGCVHRGKGRRASRCQCPIWIDFRKDGIRVHKSAHLTDSDKARALEESWMRDSETALESVIASQEKPDPKPITLDEAWQKFLDQAKARKLSPTSIYKYNLLRKGMQKFAEQQRDREKCKAGRKKRGLHLLRDFDIDILEMFQSDWALGEVAALKILERLKSFFRAATARKWIAENPALTLRGPKPKLRPTLPFTDEEMARILAAIEKYPNKSGKLASLTLSAFAHLY